jgi:hypothetical protein
MSREIIFTPNAAPPPPEKVPCDSSKRGSYPALELPNFRGTARLPG